MNNGLYAFYMNIDTQERVSVVWRVTLTMQATIEGYVDVEGATTQEEAAQLALDKHWMNVEWHDETCSFDEHGVQVCDVECENPPADAILRCPGRKTGANLAALFDLGKQATAAEAKANDGGAPCK